MAKTYVFLADGFEEIEAVTPIDLLRRAGAEVVTVAVKDSLEVTGAHGVTYKADVLIDGQEFTDADLLLAPGGMPGAANLYASAKVREVFKAQNDRKGYVAAICAAPAVLLAPLGILKDKPATCYPGFEDALTKGGAMAEAGPVVVADNVITANGPATAMAFALSVVGIVVGIESEREVAQGLLYKFS